KQLLLHKLVYFNNQYYSTPTIPAFPSKAYDNMVIKGGLNFYSAGTELKRQIDSVFLAITNKCKLNCAYCYEKNNINKSDDIPVAKWNEIIKSLQGIGVNIFILSGGEPLLAFDKLLSILKSSDKEKSDFHLHTSGNSITELKVKELKDAGLKAAAIGLDDFDEERHDKIRGRGSFSEATKSLKLFNQAGILTYVNLCIRKEMLMSDNLYKYFEFVKKLNVSMIQLLEPRPCGGYFNNESEVFLNEDDKKVMTDFTLNGNRKRIYKKYPIIYYVAHIEGKHQLGCHMGGLSHFYIDSKGNVCPCVFFPVSYGNIINENINVIFQRMRKNIPLPIHSECPSLLLSNKLKESYKSKKEFPIPFDQIQDQIDLLYNHSFSPTEDMPKRFELLTERN
ncbi:MAG TPA: radical SAM protein, partial [Ignavibacteriaceae bacterium]|nr:radical SAM protein [Ignavibacteriaceae bacterium]